MNEDIYPIASKTIVFHETGEPEVLKIENLIVPVPAAGEVRLKVKAMGINRADSMYRKGQYMELPIFPARIGYEASGIVDAVGPGVTGILVGDAVSVVPAFSLNQYATHAAYALVPAYTIEKIPATLSFEEAAALWSVHLTAYGLLIDTAKVQQGQFVLINAASSGVGLAAIQTANAAGAVSIALTTSSAKREALLHAGAAFVIATKEQDTISEINNITNGKGADILLDAVGGPELGLLMTAMAQYGKIYIYGTLSPDPITVPAMEVLGKNLSIAGFTVRDVNTDAARQKAAKTFIYEGLKSGKLKPVIAKVFPFEEIVAAHLFLESNKQVGKIIVTI